MTDIVERLRKGKFVGGKWVMQEAADEIERLREEHETVSRIVDGMTLQFVERGKEIERLREEVKHLQNMFAIVDVYKNAGYKVKTIGFDAALKEGE
jgi:archaellum component FlaC